MMNEEIAKYCLRAMLCEVPCEECNIYGKCGSDHCEHDAIRFVLNELEELQRYRNNGWIPVSEFVPADLGEDWVQVQIQEADTGFLWIPRTAEYRNDKWWLTDSDEPLEDVFKVVAWRKLPSYYQPKGE